MMQLSHEYPMKISMQFFSSQKSSTGHAGFKLQYSQCNKKRRSSQKLLSKLAKIVEDILCPYKLYCTDTVQWSEFPCTQNATGQVNINVSFPQIKETRFDEKADLKPILKRKLSETEI